MAVTTGQLAKQLEQSSILTADQLVAIREKSGLTDDGMSGEQLAKQLVKQGQLTKFQAQLAYNGKAKNLVMGSYVILEKLGEGGMGQVYKARHKRMKREVALKVLAPQFVKDEGALQRFHREVEAAARLTHQNIVTAYDADESRGTHYLVMEYVRGSDLSQIIKKSGPLSVGRAVDCVLQAATGLAYAHSQGVVHRDIKPSNLLYVPAAENDSAGTVKILDMGLARFDEGDADKAAALTGTGMLMGTIDYMAPEQAMDSKTADHRADIYSLGATLYYLITGQPMYSADTIMKRIMAHQSAEIPKLPVDEETLQALFARMVAKKVEDRIEPAQLVVSELESWLTRNQGSATAARIHGTSASATADQLGETVIKPADDTSPTSSEYQTTDVPQKSPTQPKRKANSANSAKTVNQPAQSKVVVDINTDQETVLPSKRRNARQTRRKLNSKPQSKPKQTASGGGGLFSNRKLLIAGGGGLAALLLLGGILFRFSGKDGSVVVELEGDPQITAVEIDGRAVSFTPSGTDKQVTFKVEAGSHKLSIKTADGLELVTELGAAPLSVKAGENTSLRAWVEVVLKEADVADNATGESTSPTVKKQPGMQSSIDGRQTAAEPIATKFPRPAYDPSPLPKLGTWEPVGTVEVGEQFPDGRIGTSDALPGLAMLPAKLPGIRRWNVETRLPRGKAEVAKFSPDDKLLAVGSAEGRVRIYDAESLELTQLLPGLSGGITNLDWHPDGEYLAVSHGGGYRMSIWSVTGQLIAEPDCQDHYVNTAFSPDGERLLTASGAAVGQSQICLRNVDGTLVKKIDALDSKAPVCRLGGLAWSPDSQSFASLHIDNKLRIWSREGKLKTEVDGFGSFEKGFYSIQWKPTGEWIGVVDAGRPGEIQMISPTGERGDPLKLSDTQPIQRFQWGSAGKTVYGASNNSLHVLNLTTNEVTEHRTGGSWNAAMAVSHSEQQIVSMRHGMSIHDRQVNPVQKIPLSFHPWNCKWNGLGNAFVVGDGQYFSRWDSTGKKVAKFGNAYGNLPAIAWHPDGDRIALSTEHLRGIHLGSTDREVKLKHGRGYYRLSWSADGKFFAGAKYHEKGVDVFDSSGELQKQIDCPAREALVAFHPHLDLLVVASDHELFTCSSANDWNLKSIAKVNLINGIIAWSPDGSQLFVSSTGTFDFDGESFTLISDLCKRHLAAWHPVNPRLTTASSTQIGFLDVAQGANVMMYHSVGHAKSIDAHPSRDMVTTTHDDSTIVSWDADALEPYWRAVLLPEDQSVTITAAGQIMHGDPEIVDEHLIYYVENDDGRIEMLTPTEFEKRIGQSLFIPEQPEPLVESASLSVPVQPNKPVDVLPEVMTPAKEKSVTTTPPPAVVKTPSTDTALGKLAPLELRMQLRAKDLPKFQNTLRAGQPLGEFAAVSGPGKVKNIISWSIEPVIHRGGFRSIDVRDDGLIVTGGFDGVLRLWTNEWQLVKVLPGHANSVNAVQFSPDGTMLASVSSGPRDMLAVWDVDSGQLLKFHDVQNWQGHLAWTPAGTQILHIKSTMPELIEPLTGKRTIPQDTDGAIKLGTAVAFSPDGERFVVGNQSGSVHIVDTKTLSVVKSLPDSGAKFVDWSGDGKWIAVGKSRSVDILDTRSFQIRHHLDAGAAVKFSPDSTAIAVCGNGNVTTFGTSEWKKRSHRHLGVNFYEIAWTPDSHSILAPAGIMDAASGQLTATHDYGFLPEVATAVSDDGEHVATETASRMRIFDGELGTLVREFPIPKMNSRQLIWQPNGKLVLRVDRRAAENPDRLILIDSETGKTAYQLIGHDEEIFWACWSPDGKQVASVGNDGTCRIWEAATGKQVRSLVHDDPLWWVVWDPSGAKIATGSAFSAITVWDASDGKQLREFKTLSKPLPKPGAQRATDTPFAFLKNPNQIFYMAGSGFEMLDVSSGQITSLGKASIPGGDRLSIGWSPDFKTMGLYCGYGEFHLIKQGEEKSIDVRYFRSPHWLAKDNRLLGGDNRAAWVTGYDYRRHRRLGVLLPELPQNAWATLGSEGHYVGSEGIESHIVVVAMHEDGRLMTLTPAEFSEHFGWKNDPSKVKFIK